MKLTFNFTNKRLLKRILAVSLPVFVVGASITTYLVKTNNNNGDLVNNNITITNGVKRQIYLATNDNLLTPVTVTIEKKEQVLDEIKDVINLLKEDSSFTHKDFKGVLSKDCELINATLDADNLTLNFNQNFKNYDAKLESRVIESLVWTSLQFDDVKSLKLQIEENDLTHMPLNNTPLPVSLNKTIGINSHLMVGKPNQRSVNVFYEKKINDNSYYVPVSVKVDDLDNDYEEIVKGIDIKLPIYTSLNIPSISKKIEVLQYNELDDNNNLNLTLSSKALYDEKTIDNKVFDYLVMNLMFNDENIETVSATVNDEVLAVSGYDNSVVEVSSIIFNEIKA